MLRRLFAKPPTNIQLLVLWCWRRFEVKPSTATNIGVYKGLHKFDRELAAASYEDSLCFTIQHRRNLNARGQKLMDILRNLGANPSGPAHQRMRRTVQSDRQSPAATHESWRCHSATNGWLTEPLDLFQFSQLSSFMNVRFGAGKVLRMIAEMLKRQFPRWRRPCCWRARQPGLRYVGRSRSITYEDTMLSAHRPLCPGRLCQFYYTSTSGCSWAPTWPWHRRNEENGI